jgi:nucleoside-diphosphate-sugar epimerase
VIGRRLVPRLVSRGHDVVAMTRTRAKAGLLYELGATPIVADGLDRDAVIAAVTQAKPEVVIHQMTSLASATNLRRFDKVFALTNRLRTEGTDHLLEAARQAGARRLVAQSFVGWNYERTGGAVKTDDDPLDPSPPRSMRRSLAAFVHLESVVVGATDVEGTALRYGGLYGPGTGTSSTDRWSRPFGGGSCRSSATGPGCGRSCTSTTRRARRSRPSSGASRVSTTSWTTRRRARTSGCRSSRASSAPGRRGTCPSGSDGSLPARPSC